MDSYGYALGVILTDGSAFIYKGRRKHTLKDGSITYYPSTKYWISMQCKDEDFAFRFSKALTKSIRRIVRYRPIERTNFKTSTLIGKKPGHVFKGFEVRISNKKLMLQLLEDKGRIMKGRLDYPIEILQALLNAIVDADGYITKKGNINITQKEPQWIINILRKLNIHYLLLNSHSQKVAHIIISKNNGVNINTYKKEML